MTDIPEEIRAAGEASFAVAAPLITQAVDAQRGGDSRGVISALQQLMRLGEASFYGSLAVLATMATNAVPRHAVPGGTWMPMLMVGNPPRQANLDSDPAAAFAMRFLTATLNDDEDLRLTVWHAFVKRTAGDDGSDETQRATEAATALYLMVQLAARGLTAAEQREHRTHQHPNARRPTRRSHPRDQRKR